MTYYVMHENQKVAVFTVDNYITDLKIINSAYLPVGIETEKQLIKWIEDRCIPGDRPEIKKINPLQYMLDNNGVSLIDHYWVFNPEKPCNYEQINPYMNTFVCNPTCTLGGSLRKKWVIVGNERRIIKDNEAINCRQSISEVLATEIHKRQNKFAFIPYQLKKVNNKIMCSCPNFTTINTEFVPAIDIVRYLKVPNDTSLFEFYIETCKQYGLDLRNYLDYQIMTDFVITNTDRHLNNFGIIRDSKTLNWVSYAPIFDSGNSMFYKGYITVEKNLLDIEVTSFNKKEVKLMSYVTNKDLVDISLLSSEEEVYNLLRVDKTVNEETNERIVRAYKMKIKFLEDFQNGAKIWSYNYKK